MAVGKKMVISINERSFATSRDEEWRLGIQIPQGDIAVRVTSDDGAEKRR